MFVTQEEEKQLKNNILIEYNLFLACFLIK